MNPMTLLEYPSRSRQGEATSGPPAATATAAEPRPLGPLRRPHTRATRAEALHTSPPQLGRIGSGRHAGPGAQATRARA